MRLNDAKTQVSMKSHLRPPLSAGCCYLSNISLEWPSTAPDRTLICARVPTRSNAPIQIARQAMVKPFPSKTTSAITCCIQKR